MSAASAVGYTCSLIVIAVMKWLAPLANPAVLVTAVVYGILVMLATRAGLFGIWLLVLVAASLWRYAYTILGSVAQGRNELPAPDIESMNPVGDWRVVVHFILFSTLIALAQQPLGGPGGLLGPRAGLALLAMVVLVFPASAAIMGLGKSLVAAVNPVAIVTVIKTLGRDYVMLLAACVAVAIVAKATREQLLPNFGLLSGLVGTILGVWATLAVFALIGASIHAHRSDFDIPGERRILPERDAEALRKGWRAELDLAYGSIRSGEIEEGYRTLRNLIARNGGSIEIQYWLFENMIDWEDRAHAFRVAERLIARLVEIGDLPAALELVSRCRRMNAGLVIRPGTRRLLARYAGEIGQSGLASELRTEIDKTGGHSV